MPDLRPRKGEKSDADTTRVPGEDSMASEGQLNFSTFTAALAELKNDICAKIDSVTLTLNSGKYSYCYKRSQILVDTML